MPRSRALRLTIAVIGVLLLTAARPGVASATATAPALDSQQTSPFDDQTLAVAPPQLSLVFTTALTAPPAVVVQTVQATGNLPLAGVGQPQRGDDAQTWYVPLPALAAGKYHVAWTAGSGSGSYSFTVGTADAAGATSSTVAGAATAGATTTTPTAGTTADSPTSTSVSTPETARAVNVVARWGSYLTIAALVGGLILIAVTWAEGVEYVLTVRYLRVTWGLSLAFTALQIACTRAVFTNESLGSSLVPTAWNDLTDTTPGLALLARFALLLASGWVVFGPERVVDEATQIPALLPPVLAVVTFGFTRAAGGLDPILVPAGAIHGLAFAAWFGGLVMLWRVVLAGSGQQDLVDAVRGFGRIAGPALIAIALSGLLLTAKLVGGASELLGSGYGRLLLLKALAVAAMTYAGMVNRQTVQHKLAQAQVLPGRAAQRLRRALGTELVAGIVVLGLTGWMVGSHPAGLHETSVVRHVKPTSITPIGNDNFKVELGIGPAKVGTNDLTITVLQPVQGLVDLKIRLDPIDAYVASVVVNVTPTLDGKGQMIVTGVPLDAAGQWRVTADGNNTKGALGQAQATILIGAADRSTSSTVAGGTSAPSTVPVTDTTQFVGTATTGG